MNCKIKNPQISTHKSTTIIFMLMVCIIPAVYAAESQPAVNLPYAIVDTNQTLCYDHEKEMDPPTPGEWFYGQDAQHIGNTPVYTISDDTLTVYDHVTELTWTQSPDLDGDGDIDSQDKLTFTEAQAYPDLLNAAELGGYKDWRLPTTKELYSLIDFSGSTRMSATESVPYINTSIFDFGYGDEAAGERFIDAQFCTSTLYVSTVMNNQTGLFGVNFADGRIKCYGIGTDPRGIQKTFYALFVRGNTGYGINDFTDNNDGTVTDQATGLMWMQEDTGSAENWQEALTHVEYLNEQVHLGHSDWRLPNAKELQSIVDYTISPDTHGLAAIDPLFACSPILDEGNHANYPCTWTSTTHNDGPDSSYAVYVAFGEALGWMQDRWTGQYELMDVHGAGAQRGDPKSGDPTDFPYGHGPQGDVIRIYNHVRCVRDVQASQIEDLSTIMDSDEPAEGYTLFAPLASTKTYLINNEGDVVHAWTGQSRPGNSVYLLENSDLLRTETVSSDVFDAGGIGGSLSRYAWDNTLLWTLDYYGPTYHSHHDVESLPNGNILMLAWELMSEEETLMAGADPSQTPDGGLWPDHIVEVDPNTGTIVWQWHVWDHLIQEFDPAKPNYGIVSEHPERIDLNCRNRQNHSDWLHANAVDYNPDLDQIMLSIHNFNEIWIIDHSTTTAEAAGHTGGLYGKGGDLLYRWGNPQAYGAGTANDQQLYAQHDAKWIEPGLPGEGNILIFNNGDQQLRPWSSVIEIVLPVDVNGTYEPVMGEAYGPTAAVWEYQADPSEDFFAVNISGAQRLANGNTLICNGPAGVFFEVQSNGTHLWEYINPFTTQGPKGEQVSVFRAERYDASFLFEFDNTPSD